MTSRRNVFSVSAIWKDQRALFTIKELWLLRQVDKCAYQTFHSLLLQVFRERYECYLKKRDITFRITEDKTYFIGESILSVLLDLDPPLRHEFEVRNKDPGSVYISCTCRDDDSPIIKALEKEFKRTFQVSWYMSSSSSPAKNLDLIFAPTLPFSSIPLFRSRWNGKELVIEQPEALFDQKYYVQIGTKKNDTMSELLHKAGFKRCYYLVSYETRHTKTLKPTPPEL
jgi:hypothetical protein